ALFAVATAGLNPYLLEMANIREQCSWVHHDRDLATAKATSLIGMAVAKVRHDRKLEPIRVPVTRRALVIGGKMAGLSETFPTLDCSQCILTPRMVEAGQHPRIRLYTYSEVAGVDGFIGNFKVAIRQKARYVDMTKCTGCGECSKVCPLKRNPSEFDYGMGMRPAIYMPFPQAVPARPVIDKKTCAKIIRNGCGLCEKKCARRHQFPGHGPCGGGIGGRHRGGHRIQALLDRPRTEFGQGPRLWRIRLWQVQGRDRLAAVRAAGLRLRAHQRGA